MFENMDEKQAKEKIFELVTEYYNKYQREKKDFVPGDSIRYAGRLYDETELINGVDSVLEFWLTAGRYTAELESAIKSYLNIKYAALTNSGSSANLIAFMLPFYFLSLSENIGFMCSWIIYSSENNQTSAKQ